jgi:hypothetical protein
MIRAPENRSITAVETRRARSRLNLPNGTRLTKRRRARGQLVSTTVSGGSRESCAKTGLAGGWWSLTRTSLPKRNSLIDGKKQAFSPDLALSGCGEATNEAMLSRSFGKFPRDHNRELLTASCES